MRTVVLTALSAVLGGLVGGMLIYLAVHGEAGFPGAPAGRVREIAPLDEPAAQAGPATGTSAPHQTARGSELAASVARGDRLASAGQWREAQEAYLTVLLIDSSHQAAMQGLVRVVKALARGDRTVLRRQADQYRRAIATGVETEEHYTPAAMELLVQASLRAAGDPVPSSPRASSPTVRRPAAPAPKPLAKQPTASKPKAAPPSPPAAAPAKPPATPAPQPRPAPAEQIPAVNPAEPFLTVTIGPISSGERASQIAAELTIAGFSARVQRREGGEFVITLGPYRESEARRAANHVRARFGDVPVALLPAP